MKSLESVLLYSFRCHFALSASHLPYSQHVSAEEVEETIILQKYVFKVKDEEIEEVGNTAGFLVKLPAVGE